MTKPDSKTLAISLMYLDELFEKSNISRKNEIAQTKKEILKQVENMMEELDVAPLLPVFEQPLLPLS